MSAARPDRPSSRQSQTAVLESPQADCSLRARIAEAVNAHREVDFRPVPNATIRCTQLQNLERAGMRTLPYPFGSALTLTNDIDLTLSATWRTYIEHLVYRHGLDFGDSMMLASSIHPESVPALRGDYRPVAGGEAAVRGYGTYDMLAAYHLGHIDHWHSLSDSGPRVLIVEDIRAAGERGLSASVPLQLATGDIPERYFADSEYLFAVIVHKQNIAPLPAQVVAHCGSGRACRLQPPRSDADIAGPDCALYRLAAQDVAIGAPLLRDITRIECVYETAVRPTALHKLYVCNLTGETVLDTLRWLARDFHVRVPLVTQHGYWHFYTRQRLDNEMRLAREAMAAPDAKSRMFYGKFSEPELRFSTLADDSESFARVFPELSSELGVDFLRLQQGRRYVCHSIGNEQTTRYHCDIHDVVYPLALRDGTVIYNLCAAMPPLPAEYEGRDDLMPGRTLGINFEQRLETVLANFTEAPGEIAVFYTHIGNWSHLESTGTPDPALVQFRSAAFLELKQRVFGLDGETNPEQRIWFTRASVLCDYALMVQALPEFVARRSDEHGDIIDIKSWDDPVLGKRLPTGHQQLYGLTFYTDRPSRTRVMLDGEPVSDLVLNAEDETERMSVTIATSPIRHVVFDDADPATGSHVHDFDCDGVWQWQDGRADDAWRGIAFGTVRVRPGAIRLWQRRIVVRTCFKPVDIEPAGCQHLAFALRKSSGRCAVGLVIETCSGGRFFFGERSLRAQAGETTADYLLDRHQFDKGIWTRVVIPFAALDWHTRDTENIPLPSHAPSAVTLLCEMGRKDTVDIDALEFTRPRTSAAANANGKLVAGGIVSADARCKSVALQPLAAANGTDATLTAALDQDNRFCFRGIEPGAYLLTPCSDGVTPQWDRARTCELWADTLSLRIDG